MPTYNAIATTTIDTPTSTVTFSNISSAYTDLVIVYKVKMVSGGATNTYMRINGDTGNNYNTGHVYYTIGGAQGWSVQNSQALAWIDNVDSTWTTVTHIDINNYSNTSVRKSWLVWSGSPGSHTDMKVGSWYSTAAINQIQLYNPSSVNFAVGSNFTIYGILAA